jgi:hypothetical protein
MNPHVQLLEDFMAKGDKPKKEKKKAKSKDKAKSLSSYRAALK